MSKLKTHSEDRIHLEELKDLPDLKGFHNSSNRDKVSAIFSKSLRRCLGERAVPGGEMFKQRVKMF